MAKHRYLRPRQHRFVAEYMLDLNATQAALRAGYSPRSARVTASRMLTKANIQDATAFGARDRNLLGSWLLPTVRGTSGGRNRVRRTQ